MSESVGLGLIARRERQLLGEMATWRDDMTGNRNGTVSGLMNEIRATHPKPSRP